MARRRIRGDRAFKRLIGRLPEAARDEIVDMYEEGGRVIMALQRGASPSTRIRAVLSMRVLRGALQLKVGLVGRPLNRRYFWARMIEKGVKAQEVEAVRTTSRGTVSRYRMRVAARSPHPFIYSTQAEEQRATLGGRTRTFWERTLVRAAEGETDE